MQISAFSCNQWLTICALYVFLFASAVDTFCIGRMAITDLRQTRWKTVEAANAYLAWLNALTVPPTFAHSFTFGEPQSWAENVTDTSPDQTPA